MDFLASFSLGFACGGLFAFIAINYAIKTKKRLMV